MQNSLKIQLLVVCAAIFLVACSGSDGEQGPQGPKGEQGLAGDDGSDGINGQNGTNGISCWDLNANGMGDAEEDFNQDGNFDALDCQGQDGQDGANGADGANGVDGLDGLDGTNGINCWDLNANGTADAEEDINQDGNFNALDCQGTQGLPGQDGPNTNFYFQNGFKGYEGTADAQISNINGFNNSNDALSMTVFYTGQPTKGVHTLLRFDGISDIVSNALVEEGQNCNEAYFVNQAILYLYMDHYIIMDTFPLYFHIGFYNAGDPLFDETTATWEMANANDNWSVAGGISSNWAGPFEGTDDYGIVYASMIESNIKPGWLPIPLPRSVVENWLCDPQTNKGIRIRVSGQGGSGAEIQFHSSDSGLEDLRPLLIISTEKNNTLKGTPAKDWDKLSDAEQMAPLFQFLQLKKQ
ncbi:MAG: hypothetical protein ABGX00_02255 [Allomuricauda sp.]